MKKVSRLYRLLKYLSGTKTTANGEEMFTEPTNRARRTMKKGDIVSYIFDTGARMGLSQ
jgi:hypothetical protein